MGSDSPHLWALSPPPPQHSGERGASPTAKPAPRSFWAFPALSLPAGGTVWRVSPQPQGWKLGGPVCTWPCTGVSRGGGGHPQALHAVPLFFQLLCCSLATPTVPASRQCPPGEEPRLVSAPSPLSPVSGGDPGLCSLPLPSTGPWCCLQALPAWHLLGIVGLWVVPAPHPLRHSWETGRPGWHGLSRHALWSLPSGVSHWAGCQGSESGGARLIVPEWAQFSSCDMDCTHSHRGAREGATLGGLSALSPSQVVRPFSVAPRPLPVLHLGTCGHTWL